MITVHLSTGMDLKRLKDESELYHILADVNIHKSQLFCSRLKSSLDLAEIQPT